MYLGSRIRRQYKMGWIVVIIPVKKNIAGKVTEKACLLVSSN
jgi:hypothetical protein